MTCIWRYGRNKLRTSNLWLPNQPNYQTSIFRLRKDFWLHHKPYSRGRYSVGRLIKNILVLWAYPLQLYKTKSHNTNTLLTISDKCILWEKFINCWLSVGFPLLLLVIWILGLRFTVRHLLVMFCWSWQQIFLHGTFLF